MVTIKSAKEIESMRQGGKLLAFIMDEIGKKIQPGVNTLELDTFAEKMIREKGGKPSFKGYGADSGRPFPGTICASINNQLVHGLPSKKNVIQKGDLVKIDIGMEIGGLHNDMARTFAVGKVSAQAQKLMTVTEESFWEGIKCLKAGSHLSDYSKKTQQYIEKNGFAVVRNLVGHGIGRQVHEDPQIPNFYSRKFQDFELKEGMTLAFEPMVNAGSFETVIDHDGWTFRSKDGSLTAHYENTVLITKEGVEVLTI